MEVREKSAEEVEDVEGRYLIPPQGKRKIPIRVVFISQEADETRDEAINRQLLSILFRK